MTDNGGIRVSGAPPTESILERLTNPDKAPPPPATRVQSTMRLGQPPPRFAMRAAAHDDVEDSEEEYDEENSGEDEEDHDSEEEEADDEEEDEDPEVAVQRALIEEEQKGAMLSRIAKIKQTHKLAGPCMSRHNSSHDVQFEMRRLEDELVLRQSVKVQRRMLMAAASGIEFLHHRTPASGKLTGWSETIMAGIDSYDDVFDRLHRKHAPKLGFGKGRRTEPEVEIAMMVGYSAFSFALTNTMMQLGKPAARPPADFSLTDYQRRKGEMGFAEEEAGVNTFAPSTAPPPQAAAPPPPKRVTFSTTTHQKKKQ